MKPSSLTAVEFDRIVDLVAAQAVTSPGRDRLLALTPLTDVPAVVAAQRMTTEAAPRTMVMSPRVGMFSMLSTV